MERVWRAIKEMHTKHTKRPIWHSFTLDINFYIFYWTEDGARNFKMYNVGGQIGGSDAKIENFSDQT